MKALILKSVCTWSPRESKVRLFRITYAKQKKQITFGFQPRILSYEKQPNGFKVWFLGIVFHWHNSGGGYYPD